MRLSAQGALTERAKWLSVRLVTSWCTVTVHCYCTLSLHNVHVHCQCSHCLLSLYMLHCNLALYAVTAHCTLPLPLSLYTATVYCHGTLYIVHCTLYSVHCTPQGLIEFIPTQSASATTAKTLH